MVGVVRDVTGQAPLVTGKPDPAMHAECVRRTGARRPLVVGDRLDTDIEGARRAGAASLLVLTGVTTPAALLGAVPEHRPDLLAPDAGGLLAAHPRISGAHGSWRCGGWTVQTGEAAGVLVLRREGQERPGGDDLDGLRALCVAAWAGAPDTAADVRVVVDGDPAASAVENWRLPTG
jgi:glycerol 3-phosphatase-2